MSALNLSNGTDTETMDRGDSQKIMAMAILGGGSFLFGMLPAIISERNRRRFPLTTSLLLCFGAGILLATAIVHILPEVRKQMNSNFAEIWFCGGFFIIYFIDEFLHFFFGEALQHNHGSSRTHSNEVSSNCHSNRSYGTISNEVEPLLHTHSSNSNGNGHQHHQDDHHNSAAHSSHSHSNQNSYYCEDERAIAEANARICHTSHQEPCSQAMTGTLGLFVALSLHSAIEGLAIGVQNSPSKVIFLLGAVACHKFVMGFCLGLELCSNALTTLRSHLIGILVFALGAVCGIGIGMIIIDAPTAWSSSALSIVQALAGGTLLYVTVCEVIPREKSRWHQNPAYKAAGFAQFLAIAIGFTTMCTINYFLDDDDS